MQQKLSELYESGKAKVPKKPKLKAIDKLCVQILEQELSRK